MRLLAERGLRVCCACSADGGLRELEAPCWLRRTLGLLLRDDDEHMPPKVLELVDFADLRRLALFALLRRASPARRTACLWLDGKAAHASLLMG